MNSSAKLWITLTGIVVLCAVGLGLVVFLGGREPGLDRGSVRPGSTGTTETAPAADTPAVAPLATVERPSESTVRSDTDGTTAPPADASPEALEQNAAAPSPDAGVVTGRILDRNLTPIEGVEVTAGIEFPFFGEGIRRESVEPVRTDADGTYRIAIGVDQACTLRFDHPDYARESRRGVRGRTTGVVILEDIELARGGGIAGRVVDSEGRPVAGAAIRTQSYWEDGSGSLSIVHGSQGSPAATSGEDGTFRLAHLSVGKVTLTADEPRFALAQAGPFEIEEGKTIPRIEIVLEPGREVRGVVLAPDGSPVAEADVTLSPHFGSGINIAIGGDATDGERPPSRGRSAARTAEDGSFRFTGVAPGNYAVEAKKPGFARVETAPVEAGASDVVVQLVRNGTVRGSVVDARSGDPVRVFSAGLKPQNDSSFFFSIGGDSGTPSLRRFEDPDGRFEIQDVDPGTYRLVVRAPDHAEGTARGVVVESGAEVEVAPVALEPGASIEGTVLTALGKHPIEGARVRAVPERSEGDQQTMIGFVISGESGGRLELGNRGVSVVTDAAGRFRLRDLEPGAYNVVVEHKRFIREKIAGLVVDAERPLDPMEILLRLGGGIEGTVFGSDGYPEAGATVQVVGRKGFLERVTTDGLGYYHIGGLEPGTYHLKLVPRESGGTATAMVFSAITIGDEGGDPVELDPFPAEGTPVVAREGELALQDLFRRANGSISGIVREAGAPVPGIDVALSKSGGGFFSMPKNARTDEDGLYEFADVEPGEYRLSIESPEEGRELYSSTVEVKEGRRTDTDIALPTAFVEGRVLTRRGRTPVEGASLRLQPADEGGDRKMRFVVGDGEGRQVRTDSEGRFRISRVRPGTYDLTATKGGFARETHRGIEVGEEGVSELEVFLRGGGVIQGVVRNAIENVTVAFVPVQVLDPAGIPVNGIDFTPTDQNGKFRIEGLEPGSYLLRFQNPRFETRDEPVRVGEGETVDVSVEIRPRG